MWIRARCVSTWDGADDASYLETHVRGPGSNSTRLSNRRVSARPAGCGSVSGRYGAGYSHVWSDYGEYARRYETDIRAATCSAATGGRQCYQEPVALPLAPAGEHGHRARACALGSATAGRLITRRVGH